MIKVGIVGTRALSTLMGFREIPEAEVTSICDLNEDALKKAQTQYGIPRGFRIFEDMLESDIDAVVIASPMQCHVPQVLSALEADKHVLSEVTAGVTMDELFWLIEAVEKAGKTYMFSENYCYMPQIRLIKELVDKGYFGELYYAEGEYLGYMGNALSYPNGKTSWRRYWQVGKYGSFYPTHSIGPVMYWMDGERIEEIACFGSGHHAHPEFRQEDTTVTMCRMASGKLAKIRVDCLSRRPRSGERFQLQGTRGVYESSRGMGDESMVWFDRFGDKDMFQNGLWHPLSEFDHMLPERYKRATEEQLKAGHDGGDFFVVKDFIDSIITGEKPAMDVYKACEWTAVGLLSELSAMNGGRPVKMPNFRENMPLDDMKIIL